MVRRSPLIVFALSLMLGLLGLEPQSVVAGGDEAGAERIGLVRIQGDGFVRLEAEALAALGPRSRGALEVRRQGRRVPQRRVGPGGDLVFLAWHTATPHSATAVFELWAMPDAEPGAVAPRKASDEPVEPVELRAQPITRHDDRDAMFGDVAAARPEVYAHAHVPTWFRYFIPPGRAIATPLPPLARGATHDAIEAVVYATRIGEVALRATWGGLDLGVARGQTAAGGATFRWLVPSGFEPPPDAKLQLKDVSPPAPPAPPQDVSSGRGTLWVDALRLEGRGVPQAAAALATYEVAEETWVPVVLPAADAEVHVAVTDADGAPLDRSLRTDRRTGAEGESLLLVRVGAEARLHTATTARDAPIQPAGPRADPLARAGAATHVVIATPPLLGPAERLASHRRATGTLSRVVDVTTVYDRYGFGEAGAPPIRAFVRDLMARDRTRRSSTSCWPATPRSTGWISCPKPPSPPPWHGRCTTAPPRRIVSTCSRWMEAKSAARRSDDCRFARPRRSPPSSSD